MAKYSIKDLENFTKIKAHTLRIWEQRYQLLSPERTDTNIRYYSDRDLKKIMNINLLYNNGLKISKIALLSEKQLFEKASELLMADNLSTPDEVNSFVEHILELDELSIHDALVRLVDKVGLEQMFPEIIIPLLEKIGTLWQVDSITVSHEHFISNILREFLIVQIDRIPIRRNAKGRVVLFLKENENHELSLLFYYYVLKSRGYDCFYLGQSVPMKDLRAFVNEIQPDFLFSSLIAEMSAGDLDEFFEGISEFYDLTSFFVGGFQLVKYRTSVPKNVHTIQKIEDILIK